MGNRIYIFDTTLRDGEQSPGVSLNVNEKVQIARQLELLGVDVIEAGFPIASKGDFEGVSMVAKSVKDTTVAGLARAVRQDIDRAWEALQYAAKPRIHTFIATSDLHMKYKLNMEPKDVLKRAVEMVSYAKSLCKDIEFSPEDASRTNRMFLYEVLRAVIAAGANVVNIPDTVGYMTPAEMGELISGIRKNVPNIDQAVISVHCHNDLGLAVANSLAAVQNGAQQVECTINGLGERAGNAALEEIIMALRTRHDFYGTLNRVTSEHLSRTSKMVSYMSGVQVQPNKAIVGVNAFAHESGIHQHGVLSNRETYEIMTPESVGFKQSQMVLGKHSGRHAFVERLNQMGYDSLSPEAVNQAFEKFKDLADRKKYVMDNDIEALVCQEVSKVAEMFRLERFQISSGSGLIPTSTVKISYQDRIIEEAAVGDGPVDAVFKAIDRAVNQADSQISRRIFNLEEYFIKAATGGKDALGEVTIKIASGKVSAVGHGASTDIIEASAKAYVDAINHVIVRMVLASESEETDSVNELKI